MIVKLNYVNPINNQDCELSINVLEIDYFKFKRIEDFNNDTDLCNILDNILVKLNCTKETAYGRVCTTSCFMYNDSLSEYYFYLIKIKNQLIYNTYVDKVIKRHVDNIIYEYNIPANTADVKSKPVKTKKKSIPNKFVKRVSIDMFTGEEIYYYTNLKTNEEVRSTNPDLLDELNAPKKKIKKKEIGVPISAMTFNFNLKKK